MSDLKPGIYKATVRGVPDQIVMCTEVGHFFTDSAIESSRVHQTKHVTNVRGPVVLLDLSWYADEPVRSLIEALRSTGWLEVADQIEAQTKPPKPAEPTGLGAVVEDAKGKRHVRVEGWTDAPWGADGYHWDQIDAVRVLSEGVQP